MYGLEIHMTCILQKIMYACIIFYLIRIRTVLFIFPILKLVCFIVAEKTTLARTPASSTRSEPYLSMNPSQRVYIVCIVSSRFWLGI